jgi:hypothetical protein
VTVVPALFLAALARPAPALAARAAGGFRAQIEADWLFQEEYRTHKPKAAPAMTTQSDAAGAVDGVKDGGWAFHTADEKTPWWQVDLGGVVPLSRVVVWNRCDMAERATRLSALLSDDGATWRKVYTHDGTVFFGATDKKPLVVRLGDGPEGARARFVRIQLPGKSYFHLDEVEVFGPGLGDDATNIALGRPADQSSLSQWSSGSLKPKAAAGLAGRAAQVIARARALAARLGADGVDCSAELAELERVEAALRNLLPDDDGRAAYMAARWARRRMTLRDPLIDFDAILFAKRVPGTFNHMSDQYYGWWSRPGGGLYVLRGLKGGEPEVACISNAFAEPGSFLRPSLSYDAKKVLFAWCRHYPHVAGLKDKLNKANLPEDAFYHVFEMNVDGTGLRRLTRGKYDDFDARYLPDGRVVFLSTRRGHAVRVDSKTAARTLEVPDLPDCYVRCGGGPSRPVAVYTLHAMKGDGSGIEAISPFEMFEWTPHVAPDGRILYSRWDYVDRTNSPLYEPVVDRARRDERAPRLRQLHPESALHFRAAVRPGIAQDRLHCLCPPRADDGVAVSPRPDGRDRGQGADHAPHARGRVPRDRGLARRLLRPPVAALGAALSRRVGPGDTRKAGRPEARERDGALSLQR